MRRRRDRNPQMTTPRSPRLLVVTHTYPRHTGAPAGAFVARLASAAADGGWAVRVVAPHAPGLATSEHKDGVTIERFRYAPEQLETLAYSGELHRRVLRSVTAATLLPGFLARFRSAVRRALVEHQPAVIHAHWWIPGGLVAGSRDVPLMVTCHGSDVRLLATRSLRGVARWVLSRARVITAVSAFLARQLGALGTTVASRTLVAPMPIDIETWLPARAAARRDPPVVLYAGNLLPSKGVDTLLQATADLDRRGVPMRLRILGDGPAKGDLQTLAAKLGLANVEWSSFVVQSAMVSEYGAATTVVLPTRNDAEGLGLVLVEALLSGCAVVGTRAGGIPEVVEDGVTGRLVPPNDPGALSVAIEDTLRPDRRAGWIAEGQRRVTERFSTPNAARTFLDQYERLAVGSG